jgi:hypothetical protein
MCLLNAFLSCQDALSYLRAGSLVVELICSHHSGYYLKVVENLIQNLDTICSKIFDDALCFLLL